MTELFKELLKNGAMVVTLEKLTFTMNRPLTNRTVCVPTIHIKVRSSGIASSGTTRATSLLPKSANILEVAFPGAMLRATFTSTTWTEHGMRPDWHSYKPQPEARSVVSEAPRGHGRV